MKQLRWLSVACVLVVVLGPASCSAPSKGGLVLAISTDMRTPKDINVVSVFITSDSVVKFDYLGRVLPDGTVALPATLAIVEPDKPDARIRIRVTAFEEQKARVLRDVITTVPHQQTSLLRLPLSFLDDGSGKGMIPPQLVPLGSHGAPEGDTSFDPEMIVSSCDFGKGMTSVNGVCVSAVVDSSSLPAYVQSEVYGEGGLKPSGAPASCFDVGSCFQGATQVTGVDMQSCSVQVPAGVDPSSINLALVTAATGECLGPQQCYVPLENDPKEGWAASGSLVKMVPGVCAKLASGEAQLYVQSGACAPKTPSLPVCEPTAAAADAGPPTCDGSYVITCLPDTTCGNSTGGSAALTVAGTQATVVVQDNASKVLSGTVDPSTCVATIVAPPSDGGNACDKGGTITLDLRAGTTSGVPCSNSTTATDGTSTCTTGTMTCTVARGVLEAGAFDAGPLPGPPDAGAVTYFGAVAGSVDGIAVAVADEAAAAGFINGSQGVNAVLGLVLSDYVGVCTVVQQAQAGGEQKASSTQLQFSVLLNASTSIGPGVYPVTAASSVGSTANLGPGQSLSFVSLTQASASCGFQPSAVTGTTPDSEGTGGSITLTQVTSSSVSGSFNVAFNHGSLSGTFNAPVCNGLDLQKLLTTSAASVGPDVNGICYQPSLGADAGAPDAGAPFDSGTDAALDAGTDAGGDAGTDGGVTDAGPPDVEAAVGCYMLPAGAVSWWRGEGDSTDLLGNNPAAWTGPASYGSGAVGQAFTFAGASYLASAINGINPAGGGTVEGWIQVNTIPTGTFDLFGFGLTTQAMDGGGLVATGVGPYWRPDFVYSGQTVLGIDLNAGQWSHVAITWAPPGDGGLEDVTVFVDGQATASTSISFADAGVPTAFLLGGDGAGANDLTGLLDEVTVYSAPLSVPQIQGIFGAGPAGKCQCMMATDCPAQKPTCVGGFCQ